MPRFSDIPEDIQHTAQNIMRGESTRTPVFICSKKTLSENYISIKSSLSLLDGDIYYSVKANHHPDVLSCLHTCGSNFEIAGSGELAYLKALSISPDRIICSNPVKMPMHIKEMYEYGIRMFAFDTEHELQKIAEYAPGSNVFIRLDGSNSGAIWKLSGKFGAPIRAASSLLARAQIYGLHPVGLTMHVGWNNTKCRTWKAALHDAETILKKCSASGISLQCINIGGGFPTHNVNQYECLQSISDAITPVLKKLKTQYKVRIIAEPGSFLVNNACALLAQIYDITKRKKKQWVHIDTGICQGFYWIFKGLHYQVMSCATHPSKQTTEYVITGPTLDSHDVFDMHCTLPDNIKPGDFLMIYPAGAYTYSAQMYNGFGYPDLIMT